MASPLPHVVAVEPRVPAKPFSPADPRVLNLVQGVVPEALPAPFADDRRVMANAAARPLGLLGVPFDASIPGRRGAKEGPAAIREAFRFFSAYDATSDTPLLGLRVRDHGDVEVDDEDTLGTHARAQAAVEALIDAGETPILLGGDHSLTYPHVAALAARTEGSIGIVVIDAHYDLRPVGEDGHVSSGTPFWRILEELPKGPDGVPRVRGRNIVEVGLRPFANSEALAHYAEEQGVVVVTAAEAQSLSMGGLLGRVTEALGGVDHVWVSVDIDGLDQAHAPGCSAPTPGGLLPDQVFGIVRALARDPRFAGLDLLEVAPSLDPTGNTARVAAALLVHALAGRAEAAQQG